MNRSRRRKARIGFLVVLLVVTGLVPAHAGVVALYNFDGRAPRGRRLYRLHSARHPYAGADYVPRERAHERGPALENPGGGGTNPDYYRSYFNHAASDSVDGRQVLELQKHHPHHVDFYRTPAGAGVLPADGSFSWELVVRIDKYGGTNHFGILLDATRGAGRIPNWPGRAIVCRLWMGKKGEDDAFPLHFSVPVNDRNRCVHVTTRIELTKWYHLAAVYDHEAGRAVLYVDGQEAASREVTSCDGRSRGIGIAGYGPGVYRVDHQFRLYRAYLDALAFTDDARHPGDFVLLEGKEGEKESDVTTPEKRKLR